MDEHFLKYKAADVVNIKYAGNTNAFIFKGMIT